MIDPFKIEGPAAISFSGGRTSGYMLWRVLQSCGGALPPDVVVLFANTGKEMPETLDFVRECGERWGVQITWLEYRDRVGGQFAVVDWATASRSGEPFELAIQHRKMLPNPRARFCTVELKIRTMHRYLKSLGWTEWNSVVGIRADEPRRVAKLSESQGYDFDTRTAPLAEAGIAVADVGAFWKAQPFDLGLPNMNGKTMHGNCDLCFLKGADQILSLIREKPERAIWWMEQEKRMLGKSRTPASATFRSDRPSYKQMYEMALNQGEMFKFDDEPLEDCACTD